MNIKKIRFQKVVNKVDDVLENENQNINYDWLWTYERLQMKKNSYQNIKNIMPGYMKMPICTDFIRVIKIEEKLMGIM